LLCRAKKANGGTLWNWIKRKRRKFAPKTVIKTRLTARFLFAIKAV
jgi:hypothetical protein